MGKLWFNQLNISLILQRRAAIIRFIAECITSLLFFNFIICGFPFEGFLFYSLVFPNYFLHPSPSFMIIPIFSLNFLHHINHSIGDSFNVFVLIQLSLTTFQLSLQLFFLFFDLIKFLIYNLELLIYIFLVL